MTDKITIERETLQASLDALKLSEQYLLAYGYRDLVDYDNTKSSITAFAAALAAQPAEPVEPDMRHPKIQALIRSGARYRIEQQIVEQLLEDPNYETTSIDMEYWGPLHDKLRAALTAAAQPAEPVARVVLYGAMAKLIWEDTASARNCTPGALLYAAPAAVPLNDHWIAAFSMDIDGLSFAQVEALVRHVERAHGIAAGDKP